jgi:hypothetical protein
MDFNVIVDINKNIEAIVFTEKNTKTNKYEIVYHAYTDKDTGLPVTLDYKSQLRYYTNVIKKKVDELNT